MICSPDYMFYSFFFAGISRGFINDPKETAYVCKRKGSTSIEMKFGEQFWDNYCPTDSQKMAVVLHELMHIVYEHITEFSSGLYPDKKLANIAFDIHINQQIKEAGPTSPTTGKNVFLFPSTFPELNLAPNESSYYYYTHLSKAKEKKENGKGSSDSLAGPPGNKKGTSGSKNLDRFIDNDEDIHKSWESFMEGLSDMERELIRKEIQNSIQQAAQDTVKNRGTLPVGIQGVLTKLAEVEKPVVNWKTLFNRFVGSCLTSEEYLTRRRPNLRFEESPASRRKYSVKGIVLCDSSGSMSDYDMSQISSQLHHIYKTGVGIDYGSWDAECDSHFKYDGKLTFARVKAGGTRLGCAIEYVNEHYKKEGWNFAVIGTDGYVENDIPLCKIPCLILITKNGNAEVNTKHPIIKIT